MSVGEWTLPAAARARLRDLVAEAGGPAKIARETGIGRSTLTKILDGDGDVGFSRVHAIVERTGSSLDALLGDQAAASHSTDGMLAIRVVDLAYGMGGTFIEEGAEERFESFPASIVAKFTKAPADKLRLVRGIGDSMMPTITDGDPLLIDLSQDRMRLNDQVWALAGPGDIGMIKRLRLEGGQLRAMADNPAVSDMVLADEEYVIVGRVVACLKSL